MLDYYIEISNGIAVQQELTTTASITQYVIRIECAESRD